jgi:phenylacetate-CoA ligase
MEKLPFLTKVDLRDAYPYELACVDRSEFLRMQTSSGTTRAPVICPYTRADIEQWKDIMARFQPGNSLLGQGMPKSRGIRK